LTAPATQRERAHTMLTNSRYNSFNNLTVDFSEIDTQIENINSVLELHTIIINELFNYVYDFNICHKPVYIESALKNCEMYLNITTENNDKTIYHFEQLKNRIELSMKDMYTLMFNGDVSIDEYKKTVNNDYYNALKIGMYNHNHLLLNTYYELQKTTEHHKKIIDLLYLSQRLQNGFVFTLRMMIKTNNIYSFCKKLLTVYEKVSEYEKFIPKYSYHSAYYTHSDCDTFIINFEHLKKLLASFIAGENTDTATHQNITFSAILFTLNCMFFVAGVNAFNFNGYYDSTNKHYCYDDSMEYSEKTISTDSTGNNESDSTLC
jgi:hypothetical protein